VLKKTLLFTSLLYTVALTTLSLLSSNDLPEIEAEYADKIFHTIAYALLSLLWYLTIKSYKIAKAWFIVASLAVIYGIIIEVIQGTLTEARTLDVYDILANCIGVGLISSIIIIRNKTHDKNL
jgi:VanZ family protein